jgi:hypothetical protein
MVAPDRPTIYRKKILLYEITDDKPYYYKAYRVVLENRKTPGQIQGCSTYQ